MGSPGVQAPSQPQQSLHKGAAWIHGLVRMAIPTPQQTGWTKDQLRLGHF
ncbi:hypothetical protein ACRRTK_020203 [Alexandromys fortis]